MKFSCNISLKFSRRQNFMKSYITRACTRLAGNTGTGRKKSPFWHHRTTLSGCISQLRHVSTIGKNVLNIDTSPTCPHNMVNFGFLTAEICWRVWGTSANFNGFHVLAALLHGTLVVGVSQTLRR